MKVMSVFFHVFPVELSCRAKADLADADGDAKMAPEGGEKAAAV